MKPIRYRVLLAEQLSKADKLAVAAKVSTMYSGPEAEMHSYQRTKDNRWVNENWQFEVLDRLGRVVVIKYKGAEVAAFIKRQITLLEPLPCDPVPEGVLKDPSDAWVRMDLLGLSARQVGSRLGKEKKSMDEELRIVTQSLETKERLIGALETDIFKLKNTLAEKEEAIAKLKAAARKPLRELGDGTVTNRREVLL